MKYKQKEQEQVALVLEKSDFLNILYKYKMQKITLTKAKDLLFSKCKSEPEIVLILKHV